MIKRNWADVEASKDIEYKRMNAGGYICKIVDVKDCPAGFNPEATEKGDYLLIHLDVSEGEFEGYFAQSAAKFGTWPKGGTYYASYKESAAGMFKRFINALQDSNRRFEWDDRVSDNPELIKGLEIGVVFREEEYTTRDGSARTSVKPYSVYDVNAIDSGNYRVPEKKTASGVSKAPAAVTVLDDDTELPF